MHKSCLPGVYEISGSENPLPLIFDSPHSGRIYPPEFDYSCNRNALMKAEDRYVDLLFNTVPRHGGTILSALFPRTFIDVNRAIDDIDTGIIEDSWTGPAKPTMRAAAGIGLIRRMIKPGLPLYSRKLTSGEIRERIEKYYIPYHSALENLINSAHNTYGEVWHINCHSMPSHMRTGNLYHTKRQRLADFVIGDRGGTTCEQEFSFSIKSFLEDLGYEVALNEPYSGVELVRRYSSPTNGRHSLQLEINRGLYLNEETGDFSENFNRFFSDIDSLVKFCADYVSANFIQMAAD